MEILLTPLGTSPGVLYTLIKRLNPDRVIVITSKRARRSSRKYARKPASIIIRSKLISSMIHIQALKRSPASLRE